MAVITKTWLSDGVGLEEDVEQLQAGTGISTIALNRERNDQGFSHGGVAILFHVNKCTFTRIPLPPYESIGV